MLVIKSFKLLYITSLFLVGWDVVYKAIKNLIHGKVFDEHF